MTSSEISLWTTLREGHVFRLPFTISQKTVDAFADISGDDNPVHLDDAYAQKQGFDRRVVYAGLILTVLSRFLGTRLPGHGCVWHSLAIKFRKPLYINESAEMVGTVTYVSAAQHVLRLKLEVLRETVCLAEGEVQAGIPATPES